MREIAWAAGFGGAGVAAGAAGRWLLGRLRRGTSVHCGWCEVAVAGLWGLIGVRLAAGHLPAWWVPVALGVAWLAVVLAVTDLRHRRLPDALTLPAYPAVAVLLGVAAIWAGWSMVGGAVLGAGVFFGAHAAVHFVRPGSLGAGDVKLAGPLGAVLGAVGWPTLVIAAWLAAVCTLGLRVVAPRRFRDGVPHGPGMLAATCVIAVFPARL